jgi:hypothetical protein
VPTQPSLFALSEGRRAAHAGGLTVFALVMSDPLPAARLDDLAATLGTAGADRVLLCEGAGLGDPALDATHGRALLTAAERIPPILVLFPAGGPGGELGPPLAARLGAAFGPASDLEVSEVVEPLPEGVGRLRLRRWRADRSGYRRLDPVEIERPVIAILGAHGEPTQAGTPDVEVDVIACPPAGAPGIVELASEPDELAALPLARGLVLLRRASESRLKTKLQAAVPTAVAVVDLDDVSSAALASSSPEFVLEIGHGELAVGISPRTRLGSVSLASDADPAVRRDHPTADVSWTPGHDRPGTDLLAALRPARPPVRRRGAKTR